MGSPGSIVGGSKLSGSSWSVSNSLVGGDFAFGGGNSSFDLGDAERRVLESLAAGGSKIDFGCWFCGSVDGGDWLDRG